MKYVYAVNNPFTLKFKIIKKNTCDSYLCDKINFYIAITECYVS